MILSDKSLKELIRQKKLIVQTLDSDSIQANSIDLSLGEGSFVLKHWDTDGVLDLSQSNKFVYEKTSSSKQTIIPPQSFLLATTKEYIELPNNISAFVEGKSSIGRTGLFIQNASVVVPGFKGNITLELYNANILPIKLTPGMRICQLICFQMDSEVENPYSGRYQGQKNITGPRS